MASGRTGCYQTAINVTPSPKAVVNSGDFSYFSDKGISPLPYALSEFIDNSLAAINTLMADSPAPDHAATPLGVTDSPAPDHAATPLGVTDSPAPDNPTNPLGEIHITFDRINDQSFLVIWDNGCGMDESTLRDFAIFALSPEDRATPKCSFSSKEELLTNPMRINSRISMFGVGAKMSAFFIGQNLTMVTKSSSASEVLEYRCNSSEMINEYKQEGTQCYSKVINHRPVGAVSDSELSREAALIPRIRDMIENKEKLHGSFTYAVVSNVRREFVSRFEQHARDTVFSLSEIYHWYLHGHPTLASGIGGMISITFSVNNGLVLDLKDVDSLQKQLLSLQKNTFSFSVADEIEDVAVFGSISYFPFDEVETLPRYSTTLKKWTDVEQKLDEDSDYGDDIVSGSDPTAALDNYGPVFSCWWQGRLIPMTSVDILKWMKPSFNPNSRCRMRIKGNLFFDSNFRVTQNKSTFTDDLCAMLESPRMVAQACDGSKGPQAKIQREGTRTKPKITEQFKSWISTCESLDKEVQFTNLIAADVHHKWRSWLGYEEMHVNNLVFKAGDVIHIKRSVPKSPQFAKIVKFLRQNPNPIDSFESYPNCSYVSGSDRGLRCEIVPLPEWHYSQEKVSYIKLRFIDKTMPRDVVDQELKTFTQGLLKFLPHRLEVIPYNPIPTRVAAGFMFPNTDCQVLSSSGEALSSIPFEVGRKAFKICQTFYKKSGLTEKEIKRNESQSAQGKVISFWEIDTLFKTPGKYAAKFEIFDYVSRVPDAILSKRFDFVVVPDAPAKIILCPPTDFPLTIVLGSVSTGSARVKLVDKFGNSCVPDEVHLANLVASHPKLSIRVKFGVSDGDVVIAHIFSEPLPDNCGGYLPLGEEITSLNIGIKGQTDVNVSIPVKCASGNVCSISWAEQMMPPTSAMSGEILPTFAVQLLDRFGMPASSSQSIKALSIRLRETDARIDGVADKPVRIPCSRFTPSGLFLVPPFRINSGLSSVTILASLAFNKGQKNVQGKVLEHSVTILPGITPGSAAISVIGVEGDPPAVVAGSVHSLQLQLFGENGLPWSLKNVAIENYVVECAGEEMPMTSNGVFVNAITFPERIKSSLFKLSVYVKFGEEKLSCFTTVRLIPDVGDKWGVLIRPPIRCGNVLGDSIQIFQEDQFHNRVTINETNGPKVSFQGRCSVQGNLLPCLNEDRTILTYPQIVLVGNGPGYSVLVNGKSISDFEIQEGSPSNLLLEVEGDPRTFSQNINNPSDAVDIPVLSKSKMIFSIRSVDASGTPTTRPIFVRAECQYGTVQALTTNVSHVVKFRISFDVPVNQASVSITFTCDSIKSPMVCSFPVRPWLLQVCKIQIDPFPVEVQAGSLLPPLSGRLLNVAGVPISLKLLPGVLSSMSLSVISTETKRDLGNDFFGTATLRELDGNFMFAPKNIITATGLYSLSFSYTESRDDVLELIPAHEAILYSISQLHIVPAAPVRLKLYDPSLPDSTTVARPISNLLYISTEDEFGNETPFRFNEEDLAKLEVTILNQAWSHLSRPILHIDERGRIVIGDLRVTSEDSADVLPNGTYMLLFRLSSHPNFFHCSLDFFYSSDVRAVTDLLELATEERDLQIALNQLRDELHLVNEQSSAITEKLDSCRDSRREIMARYVAAGHDTAPEQLLRDSIKEKSNITAQINSSRKPPRLGVSRHQNLQDMGDFIGIIGALGTCSNLNDCRLVSYALRDKLSCPIFRKISSQMSRTINMRHFSLELMPRRPIPSLSHVEKVVGRHSRKWSKDPRTLYSLLIRDPSITPELFQNIFSSLVGQFIVMETYADGIAFKRFCVQQKLNIGNILTYDGHVVMSSGELGVSIPAMQSFQHYVGLEPVELIEKLQQCESRIGNLEKHRRLGTEEANLLTKLTQDSAIITDLEQKILQKESMIDAIIKKIDSADRLSTARKRRRITPSISRRRSNEHLR